MKDILKPVQNTLDGLAECFTTITANQYNFYRVPLTPSAQTIIKKSGKKDWNGVMQAISAPEPFDRRTLCYLGFALHRLHSVLKKKLGVLWPEKAILTNGKLLRPDSLNVERLMLTKDTPQLLILDVKLAFSSYPYAVRHYWPIFKTPPQDKTHQITFFNDWVPEELQLKPEVQFNSKGQEILFGNNNILYISYLVGKANDMVVLANTGYGFGFNPKQGKKVMKNLEVRFISFAKIVHFYAEMHGLSIELAEKEVQDVLCLSAEIQKLIYQAPPNKFEVAKDYFDYTQSM